MESPGVKEIWCRRTPSHFLTLTSANAAAMRWPSSLNGGEDGGRGRGLGFIAISYIAIDYLREISPAWHSRLQPALWSILSLIVLSRIPFYKHWVAEFRSALPFLGSVIFLLSAFLFEVLSVRFVTAVLGLDWHRNVNPLPDTGQWLLLAMNEHLPQTVVDILRAHIIGLHHYLMLFIMLGFSVLFDSVKAPGLGLGARYLFTMAIGRLLRTITFVSTILPSPRPWCAVVRYQVPSYPHWWAQKYYVPYASDANAIREVIYQDFAYADPGKLRGDYRPDWGSMSFLIDFLRPTHSEGPSWYHLLKRASGGCNDLLYSGHMLVAVLTAMAWTEAYGGFSSVLIWLLVMHSAQREIRERHHYTVDCVAAIYVGILLWKMTGFLWSSENVSRIKRLAKLERIEARLTRAAKDDNIEEVRKLLEEVESGSQKEGRLSSKLMCLFPLVTVIFTFTIVILAITYTDDG
uniref:Sphingomyelin synthase-like domain-containing protein n=2 Tax=Opuntia streptacantha TaxID=393608 RepID=A0A7C9DGH4_OPUST